jgi:hypothetical protein
MVLPVTNNVVRGKAMSEDIPEAEETKTTKKRRRWSLEQDLHILDCLDEANKPGKNISEKEFLELVFKKFTVELESKKDGETIVLKVERRKVPKRSKSSVFSRARTLASQVKAQSGVSLKVPKDKKASKQELLSAALAERYGTK